MRDATAPRVSVITATYNWSSVLRHAIHSALWQTMPDFELLVVGDGCTDDTEQVVASFGDPRVRWHNLRENSGNQSAPNNRGLSMARAPWIAYLGHDDVWHPRHLELLLREIEQHDADLAYTLTVQVGPPEHPTRMLRGVTPDGVFHRQVFPPPSSFMHRKSTVMDLGGWRDYRTISLGPDDDLVARLFDAGRKFTAVPEITVWKFPSAWRLGSYVEKPAFEQAEMIRRITEEPDLLYREALDTALAYAMARTLPPTAIRPEHLPDDVPAGWLVNQARVQRGLPALEPPAPAPIPPKPWRSRIAGRTRRVISRVLHRALRAVSD